LSMSVGITKVLLDLFTTLVGCLSRRQPVSFAWRTGLVAFSFFLVARQYEWKSYVYIR